MTAKKNLVTPGYLAKPCLVLGTGFHRWVLGDSMIHQHSPLVSWSELILQTARKMGVGLNRPAEKENLALSWEQLLSEAQVCGVSDKYAPRKTGTKTPTYEYERQAKKAVADLLKTDCDEYPCHSSRSQYPMEDCWGSVVSLNFDSHWSGSTHPEWQLPTQKDEFTNSVLGKSHRNIEAKRLNYVVELGEHPTSKRIWFPNGHLTLAVSLRMGFRDLGFQPGAVDQAYTAVKKFERQQKIDKTELYRVCAKLLDGDPSEHNRLGLDRLPLTWVTEMLYRPVFFAGVGMSDAEIGLWWMMVQRSRNLANVTGIDKPMAYILLHENDDRLAFWKKRPCGIEPVICSDWNAGWSDLKRIAEELCGSKW